MKTYRDHLPRLQRNASVPFSGKPRDIYSGHSSPPPSREEFEGGLEKKEGKRGEKKKKEKNDKTHVKILL